MAENRMCTAKENKEFFQFALKYLERMTPKGADLASYYSGDAKDACDLNSVFEEFIKSAQNYQRMPNTIKFKERREQIKKILFNFDPKKVAKLKYEELKDSFINAFDPENPSRDSKLNSWYKWSLAIIDIARYLSRFKDINDFRDYVERFNFEPDARMALAMIISAKIQYFGFALACNALKEIGYEEFCKPDVHVIDICNAYAKKELSPYEAFELVGEIAKDNHTTPYKVDKVLWLISSGNFYHEEIPVKSQKKEFISEITKKLQ